MLVRLLAATAMMVVAASPVIAGDGVSATLDGRRLRLDRVASHQCHDFDKPVIRCFSSPDALRTDMQAHLLARGFALLGGYVTVYEHADYGGASITMASDHSSLGSLGWNDKVSSFESVGATGNFREHSPLGGFSYGYGASSSVSSLGGAYNDRFSAFYID